VVPPAPGMGVVGPIDNGELRAELTGASVVACDCPRALLYLPISNRAI
jgi:hypothetical protein